MVTVIQRYYARPGMAEAVLETRLEASRRLAAMGLPTGVTLTPAEAKAPDVPDVVWICHYLDLAERTLLSRTAESDSEFAAIRARQAGQLSRFERDLLKALCTTEVVELGDGNV